MKEVLLDQLGQLLVARVRDEMISHIDYALEGKRPDIYSRKLYQLSQSQTPDAKDFFVCLFPML